MMFSKLDLITPKISLFFKGKKTHSSVFSGILTLISYIIILIISVYFSLDLIKRQNPGVYFLNRFIEDAGFFPLNSSSMFHFFQFTLEDNSIDIVDFNAITIVGLEQYIGTYTADNNLTKYNHWLYGNCDMNDVIGLEELIIYPHFTQSACIKKYYNSEENKYYNINEKGFIWPSLIHGCSHPNRTYYGIIIERCRNSSLRNQSCKSDDEIDKFINTHVGLSLQLIDQYTEVNNYKKPFKKYFYTLTNGLFRNEFATNHLNLNPIIVKTHNGFFFDNIVVDHSYAFEQNEKITDKSNGTGIYCAYYFWMQNRLQLYERTYKRVQEILANVGGITKALTLIAQLLNSIYYKYIILLDTEHLLNSTINLEVLKQDTSYMNKSNAHLNNNYLPKRETLNLTIKNIKQFDASSSVIDYDKDMKWNLHFWKYLFYYIGIGKRRNKINIYENFRIKIISEEHIFHNHIYLFKLMKISERYKGNHFIEDYEINELINYM